MTVTQKAQLNKDLAYAKKHNLLVSVRMDRFLDEDGDSYWAYTDICFMTEQEYLNYMDSGGTWHYVYPTLEHILRQGGNNE